MTDHTTMPKVSRLEVIATGARRRWTLSEKQRIVGGALSAPRNVSATARRHGVLPSLLFTWCRLAREGKLSLPADRPLFAPALIAPESHVSPPSEWKAGLMEIELRSGRRVRVDGSVDVSVLKRLVEALD